MLYHYTSVETLFKILQTQKLRFNNLTAMDDPEEAKSEDSYNAGRWVFTSSWTDLRDNKEMFKMYGSNGNGVCISLPVYPFYTIYGNPIQQNKFFMDSIDDVEPFDYTEGIEPYCERYNLLFFPPKVDKISVIYTDDESLLYPRISNKTKNGIRFFDGMLGKYKNLKWKYQRETRYRLRPTLMNNMHRPKNEQDFNEMMLNTIYTKISDECPLSYLDIPVVLRNIEIIVGSKVSTIKRLEIQEEAKKYCPNPIVRSSNIVW